MSEQKKPLGLILIALYSGLFGIASFPMGCTATLMSGAPGAGALFTIFSLLIIAIGILLLASAYGLWTIQPWGSTFSRWLYKISIPLGMIAIFPVLPGQQMTSSNTVLQLVGIAIDVVIISYLAKPEIAGLFVPHAKPKGYQDYSRREPH